MNQTNKSYSFSNKEEQLTLIDIIKIDRRTKTSEQNLDPVIPCCEIVLNEIRQARESLRLIQGVEYKKSLFNLCNLIHDKVSRIQKNSEDYN